MVHFHFSVQNTASWCSVSCVSIRANLDRPRVLSLNHLNALQNMRMHALRPTHLDLCPSNLDEMRIPLSSVSFNISCPFKLSELTVFVRGALCAVEKGPVFGEVVEEGAVGDEDDCG